MMLPAVCYWVVSVRLIQRGGMAAECLGSPEKVDPLIPHKQSPWSEFVLFAGRLGAGALSGNVVESAKHAAGNGSPWLHMPPIGEFSARIFCPLNW